jgi:hypothetical protein
MGVTLSLVLIAVGAVLRFAVTADVSGWDLQMTGVILMIVGGIGLLVSLVFWSSWGGFSSRTRTTEVVTEDLASTQPLR